MTDRIHNRKIHPHSTAEFIAGMCAAASDETGEVRLEIYAVNGEQRFRFRREVVDQNMPQFIRKSAP